ncbi:YfhO family protein [Aggregatilineales bacterium SYSU G02658]
MSRPRWLIDLAACALLAVLWLLFFARALPLSEIALLPAQGDFYGQFYTFSAYQFDRMTSGELPLWNPYNHAGFPFIADPQTAVFYPLRLFMIAAAHAIGGWSVEALLLEGLIHFLIASIGWYAFLRLLTRDRAASIPAAVTGSLVATYGGFLTGYPLLQLAILEGAVWLPLMLAALRLAVQPRGVRWGWLMAASAALGMSWLAGHSQTSWFCAVLGVSYLLYLSWQHRLRPVTAGLMLVTFGSVTVGTTAVTLLPGLEYLRVTSRADMDFAQKANGFPLRDVVQMIVPGVVSLYSPLFISVTGLSVALWALQDRAAWFWGGVAFAALLLSFGGNAPFYGWVYSLPTGLSFFRGQERFAFLVNAGLAVMAAYGVSVAVAARPQRWRRYVRTWFVALSWLYLTFLAASVAVGSQQEAVPPLLLSTVALFALWAGSRRHHTSATSALIPLFVALELFRLGLSSSAVFIPREQVGTLQPAADLTEIIRTDREAFRIDGFRGLHDHYASVVRLQDIRGISPLFITTVERIVNRDYSHNPLAWELFAVKYVYSDRASFSTPTQILAEGTDRYGPIFLHQLDDPRPFTHLLYRADVVDSDEFAWALLNDPRYRPRESVILLGELTQPLPIQAPLNSRASVTQFQPEALSIAVETPENTVLSLAVVDYPGWQATLDGEPIPIRRAYGALMAFEIPAGKHTLALTYRPLSAIIGGVISAATWAALFIWLVSRRFRAVDT